MAPRVVLRVVAVALVAALLAGCGDDSGGTVKLKLADTVPITDPYYEAEEAFARGVEEATDGRIQIEVFPGGQLGNDVAMAQGVKLGTIDMAVSGTTTSPVTDAFYLPYLFKDLEHQRRVMDGPIGTQIRERFREDTGMVLAGEAYFSTRHLTSNRPVRDLDDLEGLAIRVPQIPPLVETWRELGASPTPIDFTELFGALQQGIVNAQENPYSLIYNASFYQVQSHLAQTAHGVPMRFLFMNEGVWNDLSEADRRVLTRIWDREADKLAQVQLDQEKEFLQQLRDEGMTVTQVDAEALRSATADVWRAYAPEAWGEGIYERIQELR
jgi:TRAP-type transport system periplasmic protein